MTTVLTLYPLTRAFRQELERRYGELDVATIPELRRLGTRELVRRLRGMRGTVVLAVESALAAGGLPALHAAGALTPAAKRVVVVGGGEPVAVSRAEALAAAAGTAGASLDGLRALAAIERTSRRLLALPRADAPPELGAGLLFLNSSAWLGLASGGSITHMVGVANAFAAEGIATTLATYTATPGLSPNVRLKQLRPPGSFAFPPELNRFRLGRSAEAVSDACGVVYERLALGSTAGAVVSRRRGVPLVVEYNGSELWAARHWEGTTRFERAAARAEDATLRHAALVVAVSKALVDELEERGVERARIVWHPNGVDPEGFAPEQFGDTARETLRSRYGIGPADTLVTFVGTFGAWHGAEVLARAAQSVGPLRFLFVGDGVRRPEVEALAGENVTIAGAVPPDEIPLHLAASDLLVAPHVPNPDGSPFFGSPTKLFEYMASGRAIVASRLDQLADVLEGVAVLVPPGDAAALALALETLAGDEAERARLGEAARSRVVERYTWRHQVRAILAGIERL